MPATLRIDVHKQLVRVAQAKFHEQLHGQLYHEHRLTEDGVRLAAESIASLYVGVSVEELIA